MSLLKKSTKNDSILKKLANFYCHMQIIRTFLNTRSTGKTLPSLPLSGDIILPIISLTSVL